MCAYARQLYRKLVLSLKDKHGDLDIDDVPEPTFSPTVAVSIGSITIRPSMITGICGGGGASGTGGGGVGALEPKHGKKATRFHPLSRTPGMHPSSNLKCSEPRTLFVTIGKAEVTLTSCTPGALVCPLCLCPLCLPCPLCLCPMYPTCPHLPAYAPMCPLYPYALFTCGPCPFDTLGERNSRLGDHVSLKQPSSCRAACGHGV